MYGFILARLISGIRAKRFEEIPLILVILGFIGFYLLWEIKSRYIYPVYPLLLSSCGAITAQTITRPDSGSRMNGSPGMNGGTKFNGGDRGMERGNPQRNSTQGTNGGVGSRP